MKEIEREARVEFVGRKIDSIFWMNDEDLREMQWSRSTLVVSLEGGGFFFCASDNNLSSPGSLVFRGKKTKKIDFDIFVLGCVGKKIFDCRYVSKAVCLKRGWSKTGFEFLLSDGIKIVCCTDHRGVAPGCLFHSSFTVPIVEI